MDDKTKEVFRFQWWYRGRTSEGNTLKLSGHVTASDSWQACDAVEREMRCRHPDVRWMRGREIEGDGETFGPTVKKMKKCIQPVVFRFDTTTDAAPPWKTIPVQTPGGTILIPDL